MFYIESYPEIVPPIIIFLLAFFISTHGTWLTRKLSIRFGVLDHPEARKMQQEPVPTLGGLPIVIAVVTSLLLTYGRSSELQVIMYVGMGIAAVGLLDDLIGVRAGIKLLVLAVGCAVLSKYGIVLGRTPFPLLDFALMFLWVAGVASAFNAIDNVDGLSGGVCVISAIMLFALGWSTWQIGFSFLAMALAGSVLGFLQFNFKPAKIYMGDTGSFFLGYILAVLVVYAEWSDNPWRSFLSGCFIVALPIYDLALTTLLRGKHGIVRNLIEAIAHSDRDHLSHRLLKIGLSHRKMLAVLYGLTAVCCVVAYVVARGTALFATLAVVIALALLTWFGIRIDQLTSSKELWVNGKDTTPSLPDTPQPERG